MKKFILILIYATLCSIPLLILQSYFDLNGKWWLSTLIYIFSFFNGSFLYSYFHTNTLDKINTSESNKFESLKAIRFPTREEVQKLNSGHFTQFEKEMKEWEIEQGLLEQARNKGIEKDLLDYWKSIGLEPKKSPPNKIS